MNMKTQLVVTLAVSALMSQGVLADPILDSGQNERVGSYQESPIAVGKTSTFTVSNASDIPGMKAEAATWANDQKGALTLALADEASPNVQQRFVDAVQGLPAAQRQDVMIDGTFSEAQLDSFMKPAFAGITLGPKMSSSLSLTQSESFLKNGVKLRTQRGATVSYAPTTEQYMREEGSSLKAVPFNTVSQDLMQ